MDRKGIGSERLIALFMLGVVLFTPPFLGIFNLPDRTFGIPTLYLYLFGAWTALIVLVALAAERSAGAEEEDATAPTSADGQDPTGSDARQREV